MVNMGVGFASYAVFKRQNRFIMNIPDVTHVGKGSSRIYNKVLVEEKSARPSISFEEVKVPHLIETVTYTGRPVWNDLKVTLYDIARTNPIWQWIGANYYVKKNDGAGKPGINYFGSVNNNFKRDIKIFMLDGCGYALEAWTYMNAFPKEVDYGDTDMERQEAMRVNVTFKYDRAYWEACDANMVNLAAQYMIR